MKYVLYIILLGILPIITKAQTDCNYATRDTIVCVAMEEEVVSSSQIQLVEHRSEVPKPVLDTLERYLTSMNTGLYKGKVYLETIYKNGNRTDYDFLSGTYLFVVTLRPSMMVKVQTALAIDSLGTITKILGEPSNGWQTQENPFLTFCEAATMFHKKYSSTATTKFLELELDFDQEKQQYLWRFRKIKSSIVNKAGDRKGKDYRMGIDALTHEVIYQSKKKVVIRHSVR